MLGLEDIGHIDVDQIKKKSNELFPVSNPRWQSIERDIKTINLKDAPETLRVFLLNHLPYYVIEMIKTKRCHNVGVRDGWQHCSFCTRESCKDFF